MKTEIVFLAKRPDLILTLAGWFSQSWEPYYGQEGPGDAVSDLEASCNKDQLPLCLVTLDADGKACGTASLKVRDVSDQFNFGPWLAAVVAPAKSAGRDVIDGLIAAISEEAKRLGYKAIYCDANIEETMASPDCWEEVNATLLVNRGWVKIGKSESLRGATAIYKYSFKKS